MKNLLLKSAVSLVTLCLIGSLSPVHAEMDFAEMPMLHMSRPTALVSKPVASIPKAHPSPILYTFKGQAVCDGQPCAYLTVNMEVVTGESRQMKKVTTDAQGRFSAHISLTANQNDSASWKISTQTQDLKSAEAAGQNILVGQSTILVNQTLNLAAE